MANALRYGTTDKGESRVTFALRRSEKGYELRIADNGMGVSSAARAEMLSRFHRATPTRTANLRVGLAVVRGLIEQGGGTLTVQSDEGTGTAFLAILPRFDIDDYLEKDAELRG